MAKAPVVETKSASFIASTSAYLNGKCVSAEADGVPYVIFQWGSTTAYGEWTSYEGATPGKEYSHKIEGLSPDTTYHFRMVGRLGDLWSYGADKLFKTLLVTPPAPEAPFMARIVEFLNDVTSWFWSAYLEVHDWVYPFWYLQYPLYELSWVFSRLAWQFYYFAEWVEEISHKIVLTLTFDNIYSYFKDFLDYATWAWNWIVNAWSNVWNIVDVWWDSTKATVQGWIDIAKNDMLFWINWLYGQLFELREDIDNLLDQIPNVSELIAWFSNWWGNILANLDTWWSEKLLDINSLFRSWTLELEPFWAGWQDWRDKVIDFFTDPEEWLYKAVDRIIERFW